MKFGDCTHEDPLFGLIGLRLPSTSWVANSKLGGRGCDCNSHTLGSEWLSVEKIADCYYSTI